MRPIPLKFRKQIDSDPYFKKCARFGSDCSGRITIEHSWIYAGRQINEMWAYVPLCWHHHLGSGLNKRINHWIALRHATSDDLKKYPRVNWEQERRALDAYIAKYAKKQ